MPIVVKHQAAGIAPSQENPRLKYGMMMTMQQQRADQEMRQRAQDAQYDMQRMGMMAQNQVPRQPSLGEESVMLDQEIRSGMYDPDTVKALRDDERNIRLIMRDRNIDATQRAQALENIQSRIRMARSTGKVQPPMMQQMPLAKAQQPEGPPTARVAFKDPKLREAYMAKAQAKFEGAEIPPTIDMILDEAGRLFDAEQRWLNAEPAAAAPQGQGQPAAQSPNAPATAPSPNAPAGQPQASVPQAMANERWGAREFGVENVLATPASPPIPGVATGASQPPQYQNAIYTAEMQERDRMNPPYQPIPNAVPGSPGNYLQYASQPQRSANMVYTAEDQERIRKMPPSEITPNWATGTQFETVPYLSQPAQQQQPMYLMEAISGMKVDPNYKSKPDSGFMSPRTFTSADGRSMVGSIAGVIPPSSSGGFETVQIRKESDGKVYDVPLNNLSEHDQMYVLSGGNRDIMYDLQNPNRSSGFNYMDPNNPVRREMSAADQSIVNPQKQTLGKTGGRYGMGMVDYGINPATGNRVTASIRPGSTMPEYDPPGPSEEQLARDKTAREKQKAFNEKVRRLQGGAANNQALVAGGVAPQGRQMTMVAGGAAPQGGQMQPGASQDAPALTKLLSTMTTSQRRDYSKWLMEEPDRYAMRNQIAQQQLNQTAAAAAGNGQLPKYPGFQQRIQERNQQQGRMPMQGQLGQQPQPAGMGIDQAIAIARNPNASLEDQKRAADVMVKNGITTTDQAKEVVGRVASPSVTDQGDIPDPNDPRYGNYERGKLSPYPYSETYKGGAVGSQKTSAAENPATAENPSVTESSVQQDAVAKTDGVNVRKWTSADGKKTFDGSLVELSYDSVDGRRIAVFNSVDGQVFKIPIENLSEEDIAYLRAVKRIEGAQNNDWIQKYPGIKLGSPTQGSRGSVGVPTEESKSKYIGPKPKEMRIPGASSSVRNTRRTS